MKLLAIKQRFICQCLSVPSCVSYLGISCLYDLWNFIYLLDTLPHIAEKSLFKLFLEQFNDLLPQILLAAAFISFVSVSTLYILEGSKHVVDPVLGAGVF